MQLSVVMQFEIRRPAFVLRYAVQRKDTAYIFSKKLESTAML